MKERASDNELGILRLLRSITDKGNDAEVKKASDGTLKVYEVRKTRLDSYSFK